jgi:1-acyl-sn-glycerol-3-phosphate acyltransferase
MLAGLGWAALAGRSRSFACDAQRAVGELRPELEVLGQEHIPARGPCLVVCNHYSRPGFEAWWIGLAVSAAVAARRASDADAEIHWVMTAAWTFPESRWRRRVLTPITRWAFRRVAAVYGFVAMPPMPPDPSEVEARALAVRQTLRLAKRAARDGGMVGIAPEGMDVAHGLGQPPAGAGRFVAWLVRAGLPVLPVGVAEAGGRLRASFGPLFVPMIPAHRKERDREVSRQVMAAIARQLP